MLQELFFHNCNKNAKRKRARKRKSSRNQGQVNLQVVQLMENYLQRNYRDHACTGQRAAMDINLCRKEKRLVREKGNQETKIKIK